MDRQLRQPPHRRQPQQLQRQQQAQQPKDKQTQQQLQQQQPQQPKDKQNQQPQQEKVSSFFKTLGMFFLMGIVAFVIAYLFSLGLIILCNVCNFQTLGDIVAKGIYAVPIIVWLAGIVSAIYVVVRKNDANEKKK